MQDIDLNKVILMGQRNNYIYNIDLIFIFIDNLFCLSGIEIDF